MLDTTDTDLVCLHWQKPVIVTSTTSQCDRDNNLDNDADWLQQLHANRVGQFCSTVREDSTVLRRRAANWRDKPSVFYLGANTQALRHLSDLIRTRKPIADSVSMTNECCLTTRKHTYGHYAVFSKNV